MVREVPIEPEIEPACSIRGTFRKIYCGSFYVHIVGVARHYRHRSKTTREPVGSYSTYLPRLW